MIHGCWSYNERIGHYVLTLQVFYSAGRLLKHVCWPSVVKESQWEKGQSFGLEFTSLHGLCWAHIFLSTDPWLIFKRNFLSLFFSFIFISWRLITLQYCSGFCHTLTWISHGFACIPHPDPRSHLPLHPTKLRCIRMGENWWTWITEP